MEKVKHSICIDPYRTAGRRRVGTIPHRVLQACLCRRWHCLAIWHILIRQFLTRRALWSPLRASSSIISIAISSIYCRSVCRDNRSRSRTLVRWVCRIYRSGCLFVFIGRDTKWNRICSIFAWGIARGGLKEVCSGRFLDWSLKWWRALSLSRSWRWRRRHCKWQIDDRNVLRDYYSLWVYCIYIL